MDGSKTGASSKSESTGNSTSLFASSGSWLELSRSITVLSFLTSSLVNNSNSMFDTAGTSTTDSCRSFASGTEVSTKQPRLSLPMSNCLNTGLVLTSVLPWFATAVAGCCTAISRCSAIWASWRDRLAKLATTIAATKKATVNRKRYPPSDLGTDGSLLAKSSSQAFSSNDDAESFPAGKGTGRRSCLAGEGETFSQVTSSVNDAKSFSNGKGTGRRVRLSNE